MLSSKGDDKSLAKNGFIELEGIGTRFGSRFQDMLQGCKEEDVLFETTSKSRALDSGKTFRDAIWKAIGDNDLTMPKFKIRDDLLRSYDNCSDYIRFVEGDPSYMFEYKDFRRKNFPDISKKLSAQFGSSISFTDGKSKRAFDSIYGSYYTKLLTCASNYRVMLHYK